MTAILARFLGLYFLTIGLAFLINPDRLKNIYQQIKEDNNFLLMGGLLALLIGALIISTHNQWIFDWSVIITLLGWWSLIKGFALLTFPHFIKLFSFLQGRSIMFYRMISFIYLIVGSFLVYKGWQ